MSSGPITSWQIDGEQVEAVTDVLFLGSKTTVDGVCGHDIQRWLLLGGKAASNLSAKLLQLCLTLCDPMNYSPPGSPVHGILQAGILEWVFMPFSRGSSQLRDLTCVSSVSCIGRWVLYHEHHLLKSKDITLPTKVHIVKAMFFFPVVMYGRESWTIKKAEHWRTDAFKLWCWRRLLRFPWKVRRSNQPTLKEINPECSLEGLMLKLKLQYLGCLMRTVDSLEKTLMLGKIEGRRRRGWQRMRYLDGITDQWTWTWANSGRWWGTEKPGVLQSMVSGRVGHDLATEQQQKLLSAVQVVLSVCNTKY